MDLSRARRLYQQRSHLPCRQSMKLRIEYLVRRFDVAGRIGSRFVQSSRPMERSSGVNAAPGCAGESANPDGSPCRQAYTLVEMMVASGLFSFVVLGVLACQIGS